MIFTTARTILRCVVQTAFALSAVGVLQAGTLTWNGNTAGNLTWNRPTINTDPGSYLALVGGGQGYLGEEFTVDTSGNYSSWSRRMEPAAATGMALAVTSWDSCTRARLTPPIL